MPRHRRAGVVLCAALAATLAVPPCLAAPQASPERMQGVPGPREDRTVPAVLGDDYVIGVEDVLFISVWKNADLSREVPVRPDGKITLPLVDDVTAAGLTPEELKATLTEAWKSFITAPEVSVIVTQVNSLKVYMIGQVVNPGIQVLKGPTRLLQALSLAGGFSAFANPSKIVVLRRSGATESRLEFNYKKILSGSRPEDNILLMPGDTVIVP